MRIKAGKVAHAKRGSARTKGAGTKAFFLSLFLSLLVVSFIVNPSSGLGSSARFLDTASLAKAADAAAWARIMGRDSGFMETQEGRFPFIFYEAELKQAFFGAPPARFIIRVPGLASQGLSASLPGAPSFSPGFEAVFFLRKAGPAAGESGNAAAWNGLPVYDLVGLSQAVFPVIRKKGQGGKEKIVIVPAHEKRASAKKVQLKLRDLAAQIKAARENQAKSGSPGEKEQSKAASKAGAGSKAGADK